MLYKYPQAEFPYQHLVEGNRGRGKHEPELEILDTGIFDDDRYFDVFVEYAKASPNDVLAKITVHNRGDEAAEIEILPQLWFRNTWSWRQGTTKPVMMLERNGTEKIVARHPDLGEYHFFFDGDADPLFTENETNTERLYGVKGSGHAKDAFHAFVVGGDERGLNADHRGTKAALRFKRSIPAKGAIEIRLRLADTDLTSPFDRFDAIFALRQSEADEFYAAIGADKLSDDERLVQRQAFAGMIWSKQLYHYDVPAWISGDPAQPPPPAGRKRGRNKDWAHLNNFDVISMPDKWEYPWYAAWDLAFHCIPLAIIDPDFAKNQLVLLTREWYMHPNGQLPAYEWALGDVNPPVHAWATWRVFQIDRKARGDHGDLAFLERVFHKLMLNFTWWVNRKDEEGRNIFQGGFLGLDNIGLFDRSAPLPTGGHIDQADGTSWMAMYSLNLMRIALELARHNPVYEDVATKFFEHFMNIAEAMTNIGGEGIRLWDEQDEFYYDVLHLAHGESVPLKVRSMVGLIPLFAVETLDPDLMENVPGFHARLEWFLEHRPDLARLVSRWAVEGKGERRLLSLLRGHRMKCLLRRMLDESEFLSDFGVRAISKHHDEHPYSFAGCNCTLEVRYEPGESSSGLFGGNSNWRGPIWFPVNYLLIESLQKFHHYYGDEFKVECPTGSGRFLTLQEIAAELSRRLSRLFLRDERGCRPALAYHPKLHRDPYFKDLVLFHEYFHGETGRGVGASHQTGWTGLVAKLLQPRKEDHP
jgi:hypothetical protein